MEIILDRHPVTKKVCGGEEEASNKAGSRRRSDATLAGRAAFKLYFFRDHQ
jgi:hypothetical protein